MYGNFCGYLLDASGIYIHGIYCFLSQFVLHGKIIGLLILATTQGCGSFVWGGFCHSVGSVFLKISAIELLDDIAIADCDWCIGRDSGERVCSLGRICGNQNNDANFYKNMGKKIIINYRKLSDIGGIEVYVVRLIDFMINHGVHVIWLKEEGFGIHDSFKNVLLDERVEIVPVSNNYLLWFKYGKFHLDPQDEVIILSFIVMNKLKAESIVRHFRGYNIKSIYAIPDTKGLAYHIESNFSGIFKKYVWKLMRQLHDEWQKNNQLMFFAKKQVDALENTYGIKVNNGYSNVLKKVVGMPALDIDNLKRKLNREKFNIITIGRLDFPHKGYILGLVKAFKRLKIKYPQLTLTIVGDGHSRKELEAEIDTYADWIKMDIHLVGTIATSELPFYLKDAHLNISVAGGVGCGAMCGVLSIPPRNYCVGECEVYGFLPDSRDMAVATCPGELVDSYIEQVINMSNDEFYRYSVNSYKTYKDAEEVNPWFVFEKSKDYIPYIVPKRKLRIAIIINYLMKIKYFLTFKRVNRVDVMKHFLSFKI